MKKILALSLALLMMAASLAACNKKTSTLPPEDDDDAYVSTNNNPSTSDPTNPEDNKNPDSTNTPQTGAWVEQVDTVYAGVDLRLRTSASASNNNNVAKIVDFGTKLNRSETNGTWSKVTLDGDSQVYYVSNTWISASAGHFNIVDCTPEDLTINNTSNNIIFFTSPFECDDQELYFENTVCASGFKLENIKDGTYTLKKTGTSASGAWIRVEFVGTIVINDKNSKTFTADEPGELYVKIRAIERGDITDPTYSQPSGSVGGHG